MGLIPTNEVGRARMMQHKLRFASRSLPDRIGRVARLIVLFCNFQHRIILLIVPKKKSVMDKKPTLASPIVVSLVRVENPSLSTIDVVADGLGVRGIGDRERKQKGQQEQNQEISVRSHGRHNREV